MPDLLGLACCIAVADVHPRSAARPGGTQRRAGAGSALAFARLAAELPDQLDSMLDDGEPNEHRRVRSSRWCRERLSRPVLHHRARGA